ncbi:MAG: hypothetical protein RUMPE_00599 [Eubacteriales bacterium SKADARSKE-1]|nr:hypothetical protein [Eubacteriales bacterium SKADARSKE-1]
MTDITNIYKKGFSKIENIQSQEVVFYNLSGMKCDDIVVYGIELASQRDGKLTKLSIDNISDSKMWVIDIITYLYENAIKPEISLGVIDDIINSTFL